MKMRLFDPDIAEILSRLDKEPLLPTLRTFADIVKTMRDTHDFLAYQKEQFEQKLAEKQASGKFTQSGLNDLRADFNDVFKPYSDFVISAIRKEIDNWKDREQKNAYAVINKAPTDDQARKLEVVLKRDKISKSELELWARNFGDNYLCASAFRDFAEKKGYQIIYSDFTDADERLEDINKAYEYLNTRLSDVTIPKTNLDYQGLAFYGTDDNGDYYNGTLADIYTESLDRDSTFKPQTIDIKPIESGKTSIAL